MDTATKLLIMRRGEIVCLCTAKPNKVIQKLNLSDIYYLYFVMGLAELRHNQKS